MKIYVLFNINTLILNNQLTKNEQLLFQFSCSCKSISGILTTSIKVFQIIKGLIPFQFTSLYRGDGSKLLKKRLLEALLASSIYKDRENKRFDVKK